MRKNPYFKQEQEFLPLLMRGSFGNDFLNTDAQTRQELVDLTSSISKETYTLNGISFDMVLAHSLNTNGTMLPNRNVEMCSTECTQELFEEVMGFNYSKFKGKDDSAQRPIEQVTWFDCIVFCNKLSEMLRYAPYYDATNIQTFDSGDTPRNIKDARVNIIGGNGFRLPTLEEWLAFARAGTNNRWSGTDDPRDLRDFAWFRENSSFKSHPVATKKPNGWGMYDMSGNVHEWIWDQEYVTDSSTSAHRVVRGGSWWTDVPTYVSYLGHSYMNRPNTSDSHIGFRFARTIEQK